MKYLLSLLLFLMSLASAAQVRCGTDAYYKNRFRNRPDVEKKFRENQEQLRKSSLRTARLAALSDTLTVVVHVVANASIQQQVTDAMIQSQIDVLNEDYSGSNADTTRLPAAFRPLRGKSALVFQLAGTSPLAEPTSGIERITTTQTYNQFNFDLAKQSAQGGSDAWDPTRYINIWVVSFGTTGVLGQSVFPGDPLPLALHGFVCDYRAFGRGAPYLYSQYNKGRTTTHELAHFFNLQHIWGDDDGLCLGTDFPNDAANDDTPNQGGATLGNPDPQGRGQLKTDACSPSAPGILYQNFMDYTDDVAMVLFTKGQQQRLQNVLTSAPDRSPLLASTRYKAAPVNAYDARLRRILSPLALICQPAFRPEVVLRNSGSLPLTSVKITSLLNNGSPQTFTWTGSLAPYSETSVELPLLNGQPGANFLKIFTEAPNGNPDANRANDTVVLSFEVAITTPLTGRFDESFSGNRFPPARWQVLNPDGDLSWQHRTDIGNLGPGSAWFNGWNNFSTGRHDDLVTPSFSYTNVDSVFLSFYLAAASGLSPGPTDTLSVLVTRDCGHSFTTVYRKWGRDLLTLRDTAGGAGREYFPRSGEWRRDSIRLQTVLDSSEAFFQLYFRLSGNSGNNVFLDDVQIVTRSVPQQLKENGVLVLPTVFRDGFAIWHYQPPANLAYAVVYNAAGQAVWRQEFRGDAQTFIRVDLPRQPAGVYFVKLGYTDSRHTITRQVIKTE
ncbi:M43 family zinc metalloprotease [Paraflavisolibacter sp. H34]|uniref:M43 family zinc metalloprotease n=1 Tax=Huijunlia imazamoxiresistens TaxID=3127457 RepID=UPI003016749E